MKFAPISNPSVLRFYIQAAFAAFFVYVSWEFFQYYLWVTGGSAVYVAKPPAAEAFLPIAGLVSFKYLLASGNWDPVHPAGLVIFIMAMLVSLAARKAFCGYFCPVGFITGRLGNLGKRLGMARRPRKYVSWLLSIPKYLLLLFFAQIILLGMDAAAIEGFMTSPYNMVVDSKMLLLFLNPSVTLLVALVVIALGCMLIPGFWCRGLCPYGALLGLFSMFSPLAVTRDEGKCIRCGRCNAACPTRIPVQSLRRVSGPECQGCLECVAACPITGCLGVKCGYGVKGKRMRPWVIPLAALGLLYLCYVAALATGHWHSSLPPEMIKTMHGNIASISHY